MKLKLFWFHWQVKIQPCINCDGCIRKLSYCILKDDWLEVVSNIIDPVPNGLVLGSPVYFFSVNSAMRAFMERLHPLSRAYGTRVPASGA